jgi:hypothetical protein
MGQKLNMIDWSELTDRNEVSIHKHSPASEEQGFPIYSVGGKVRNADGVLVDRVLGHTTAGQLVQPHLQYDKFQLEQAINNNGAKTRNMFVKGRPVEDLEGEDTPVQFRGKGAVLLNNQKIFNVPTRPGLVRLRERIPGTKKYRLGDEFMGTQVVGTNANLRSHVFAEGVRFGGHGLTAVNPLDVNK